MRIVLFSIALAWLGVAAPPPRPMVLKAARMFDGRSSALVTPGLVVVADGKIVWVGPGVGTEAQIRPDAEVIDLGDATLLPGFMDAHTHLSWRDETG